MLARAARRPETGARAAATAAASFAFGNAGRAEACGSAADSEQRKES